MQNDYDDANDKSKKNKAIDPNTYCSVIFLNLHTTNNVNDEFHRKNQYIHINCVTSYMNRSFD